MMHERPDRTDVMFPLLRNRQRRAHQATDPPPQRGVEPLDGLGCPRSLPTGQCRFAGSTHAEASQKLLEQTAHWR